MSTMVAEGVEVMGLVLPPVGPGCFPIEPFPGHPVASLLWTMEGTPLGSDFHEFRKGAQVDFHDDGRVVESFIDRTDGGPLPVRTLEVHELVLFAGLAAHDLGGDHELVQRLFTHTKQRVWQAIIDIADPELIV